MEFEKKNKKAIFWFIKKWLEITEELKIQLSFEKNKQISP